MAKRLRGFSVQFDFAGLVTKSEEYLGKPATRLVFAVVVFGIVCWALRLIYDVMQPLLTFIFSLVNDAGRNADLVQAAALLMAVLALLGIGWLGRRTWVRTTGTLAVARQQAEVAGQVGQAAMADIAAIRKDLEGINERQTAQFGLIKQIVELVTDKPDTPEHD